MGTKPKTDSGTVKPFVLEIPSKSRVKVSPSSPFLPNALYLPDCKGGWDRETEVIPEGIPDQITAAFDNIEHALQVAGSKGWEDVYFVRSYFVPMSDEAMDTMVGLLKKYCPNHKPGWTALSVPMLAGDAIGMKVEIEVKAYVGEKQ